MAHANTSRIRKLAQAISRAVIRAGSLHIAFLCRVSCVFLNSNSKPTADTRYFKSGARGCLALGLGNQKDDRIKHGTR